MAISVARKYKSIRRDGIVAIIIHNKKILLLKRRNVPLILNPGIWSFLSGGRDGKEKHIDTAYREIYEEVKLPRSQLRLLASTQALLKDERKRLLWPNKVFIFHSGTNKITLDFENSAYRWAPLANIVNEKDYTNVFINEKPILDRIKVFLDGTKGAKGKSKKGTKLR